jgi:hypothetical protein
MESQYVEEHPEQFGEVVAESEAPPQLPTFGDIPLRECAIGRSLLAAMDEADWLEAAEILDGLYAQFLDLDSHYIRLFPQAYPIFRSAQESLEFLLDVEYPALWSANDQNILPADLFQEVDIRICSPSDESGPE